MHDHLTLSRLWLPHILSDKRLSPSASARFCGNTRAVDASLNISMRWRTLLAAKNTIRSPLCRPRLPFTSINKLRRPLSFQTITASIKNLLTRHLISRDEMAQQVAPLGDIPLLQRLLGLPVKDDAKELQDVVFVCIDCEAHEFNQQHIMEVGVSVLDTANIDHVSSLWQ